MVHLDPLVLNLVAFENSECFILISMNCALTHTFFKKKINKPELVVTKVFVSHLNLQHLQMTVQALQDELRIQRDLNQLFQQDPASHVRELALTSEPTEENYRRLQAEHERQAKELFLLRKTLEEMELRIDTQKQTLGARDESIKKLLEMLQSKGPTSDIIPSV